MKHKTQKTRLPPTPFETGQIWRMENSNVEIGFVGKRLVHYKYHKGRAKGPPTPTSLSGQAVLKKFLRDNQAFLVPE